MTAPTPDLDVLAGLLAEATPGPWRVQTSASGETHWIEVESKATIVDGLQATTANLDAMVAAVNALPSLIERVRAAEAEAGNAKADGYQIATSEFWPLAEKARAERDEARAALGRVEAMAQRQAEDLTSANTAVGFAHEVLASLAPTPGAEQEGTS